MPRVTQSYRDQRVARILAAEICFARRGLDGASMDEIIAEAGMSSSTVYRYFPEGRRSLVRAVLGRATDPVVERIITGEYGRRDAAMTARVVARLLSARGGARITARGDRGSRGAVTPEPVPESTTAMPTGDPSSTASPG